MPEIAKFEVFGVVEVPRLVGTYEAEVLVRPPIDTITEELGRKIMEAAHARDGLDAELPAADKFTITKVAEIGGTQHLSVFSSNADNRGKRTLQSRLDTLRKYHTAVGGFEAEAVAGALGLELSDMHRVPAGHR